MLKRVYRFEEGNAEMKNLLGGKGANLAEMTALGLPIPPGFTVTTEACQAYYTAGGKMPEGLMQEIHHALRGLEEAKSAEFGGLSRPLLVSVRSGSVTSMPGMMDTILNLGLNDDTVKGLAEQTGNERFAYDCYRRFIQMFGDVVLGIHSIYFERLIEKSRKENGRSCDQEISAGEWKELIAKYKWIVEDRTGQPFPQDVRVQLKLAVEAVFRSWNNMRAKVYRKAYGIPDEQGTAVNIQAMVFGNLGSGSGTGVLFTRNPSTGERELYGEYLADAQGEDVVAGVRTPKPVSELCSELPLVYEQLSAAAGLLEMHYRDMQDIEFTVENGILYLLQTRSGKRTAQASVKIAVDLTKEGILSKEEAVSRIEPGHLDQLLHRSIAIPPELAPIAKGLPASPGAAVGLIALDADTAERWAKDGRKVVLVSTETSPDDIHGILAAEGVLTSRGGMTSHAAVVARGMGKPCICGCEALSIDHADRSVRIGELTLAEGEEISLDASGGEVFRGGLSLSDPEITPELLTLLDYADEIRKLRIYANADTPHDARKAREFGAEGIGLCRTEHMFFSGSRLPIVQSMILAGGREERMLYLDRLLPMQQADFEDMFLAMDGLPVTVRLLDPPLHEFLPNPDQLREQCRKLEETGEDGEEVRKLKIMISKVNDLREVNPMLGLRGVRLGILFPEIYEMQIEAIFKAAQSALRRGVDVRPEIMIPLVGHPDELKRMRALVDDIAGQVLSEEFRGLVYRVGTMIEVPRAALLADAIAQHADFFSFGTNDLTQMTFGYSRDDAEGKFLNSYLDGNILKANPFQVLDQDGVGQLIQWAVTRGKAVKSFLKTGICGEHGGDRESISFCHRTGLEYVSCSPYRIPFARIAAAQAALLDRAERPQSPAEKQVV
ncbi:pyruvate, phosphate dikinase [Paenibacillus rhizophilus]|uniref:Pyruvate, phosphate dikinase n=1 Tax=Paenibacillus rhizophilus TaxID=1850366 RepID=A0A3N9P6P2_9BACL|nr:pyruvate, phosphate dikinase [Paenibacillus rhizophilus]RQW11901.1 pyruvate, phosphate dikinase [Paenibacillus rhizophilus]